jgi:hypothetical protein
MHAQIIMDRHGDTRHEFDPEDIRTVERAEERFRELTGKGFRAVALGKAGEPGKLLRSFDPETEETLFIPQLQGG